MDGRRHEGTAGKSGRSKSHVLHVALPRAVSAHFRPQPCQGLPVAAVR